MPARLVLLAAFATLCAFARPAVAEERPVNVSARAFAGLEDGLGLTVDGLDRRLEGEVMHSFGLFHGGGLTDVAVTARVAGSAEKSVALRVGWLHAHLDYDGASGPDVSESLDVGVRFQRRWAAGHSLAAEGGVEEVVRGDRYACCDHAALDTSSVGVRVMLAGELALAQHLALFMRLGVRTGDHLLEIKLLPVAFVGVAVNL